MIVNDELVRMQKEAIVTYFKALFWNSPDETEEDHENPDSVWPVTNYLFVLRCEDVDCIHLL
jgi:hypothetical protein